MNLRRTRTLALLAASLTAGLVVAPKPAGAITFGTPTGDGQYRNVASLLLEIPDVGVVQLCTGTLIAPNVVLTASHCLVGFPEGFNVVGVTFDATIDSDKDGVVDDGVTVLPPRDGDGIQAHPSFASGGNNNTYDVGAIILADDVAGRPVAGLPALGALDTKAAKGARYTAVGYGTVRSTKSGGSNSFEVGWQREYVAQSVNSVTKSWVTFSMNPSTGNGGTCYGDSGGPHFTSGGTVVAVTVTGDRYCRSTDKSYRLDTADAQAFIQTVLGTAAAG